MGPSNSESFCGIGDGEKERVDPSADINTSDPRWHSGS